MSSRSILKSAQLLVAGLLVTASAAFAQIAYMSGPSEPWSSSTNITAMDLAFGSGNWTRLQFSGSNASALSGYKFAYIDGGDGQTLNFSAFLDTNRTGLENWVSAGGRLYINAGMWDLTTLDVGFGATLTEAFSDTGDAVNPLHPIFQGPQAVGTSFTGDWFSHDIVTGSGFSAITNGVAGAVLVERSWGLGHVLIGGITTSNFHDGTNPVGLRANELFYAASAPAASAVPEPSTYGLIGAAFVAVIALRRRAKATSAA